MKTTIPQIFLLAAVSILLISTIGIGAWVVREDDRIYIKDRQGEEWDVTEAVKLGFVARKFQYGIGKYAFTPLDDEDFAKNQTELSSHSRIIAIADEGDAHAYAVNRLIHHEIANTNIGGKPIAVGY